MIKVTVIDNVNLFPLGDNVSYTHELSFSDDEYDSACLIIGKVILTCFGEISVKVERL